MNKDKNGHNWYPRYGYAMLNEFYETLCNGSKDIIIYDTETTGTTKSSYIVQISAVKCSPSDHGYIVSQTLNEYIKPPIPMPAQASAVNHITDELLADKPTEAQLADTIIQFFDSDAIIAGYNHIKFDNSMLNNLYLRTVGHPFKPEYNADAMIMARGTITRKETDDESFTLGAVARAYGIKPEENESLHNSFTDVSITMQLLWALARDFEGELQQNFQQQHNKSVIAINHLQHIKYSKTNNYVVVDVSCENETGQFRYDIYEKTYTEITGNVMEIGNMEQFILDADIAAKGDIAKVT